MPTSTLEDGRGVAGAGLSRQTANVSAGIRGYGCVCLTLLPHDRVRKGIRGYGCVCLTLLPHDRVRKELEGMAVCA